MSLFRVLICIIFPPLAIIDKGCGSFLIVFILTLCGWIPGVIAALIINNKEGWKDKFLINCNFLLQRLFLSSRE